MPNFIARECLAITRRPRLAWRLCVKVDFARLLTCYRPALTSRTIKCIWREHGTGLRRLSTRVSYDAADFLNFHCADALSRLYVTPLDLLFDRFIASIRRRRAHASGDTGFDAPSSLMPSRRRPLAGSRRSDAYRVGTDISGVWG